MPTKLSDSNVANLKLAAGGKPREVRDTIVPDLTIRVSPLKGGRVSRTWKIILKVDGKRVPRTLGHHPEMDVKAARAAARALLEGKATPTAALLDGITLHRFATERYLPHVRPRLRTADDWAGVITREFPDVPLTSIDTATVLGWQAVLTGRGLKNSTVNRHMSALASCLGHAQHLGLIPTNPASQSKAAGIRLPQERERSRFFSPEEWERFDEALNDSPVWFADLCRVGIGCGARKAEILNLTAEDIDLAEGVAHFRAETTKTATMRSVPLTRGALEILKERAERFPEGSLFADAQPTLVQYRFDQTREAAGISKLNGIGRPLSFRSIRTTVGSWLAQRTGDIYAISKILGNSPDVAAAHYGHLLPRKLVDVMSTIDV
jgi:integrase